MRAMQPAILVAGEFLDHREFDSFANHYLSGFVNVQFGSVNLLADNRLGGQLIRCRNFERDFARLVNAYDCLITCSEKHWLKNCRDVVDKSELIGFELCYEPADNYRWYLMGKHPEEETASKQILCLTVRNFYPLTSKYASSQWIEACERETRRVERLLQYCRELVELLTLCEPDRLPFDALKAQLIGQKEFRMGVGTASGSTRSIDATSKAIKQSGCEGHAAVLVAAVYGRNISRREKDDIHHQLVGLRKDKATPLHILFQEKFQQADALKVVVLAAGPEMAGTGTAI